MAAESEVSMQILRTVITSLLIFTLSSNGFVSASEAGASVWAVHEISEALDLEFIPVDLQNQYSANITRAEFAKVTVNFLALQFSYIYSRGV